MSAGASRLRTPETRLPLAPLSLTRATSGCFAAESVRRNRTGSPDPRVREHRDGSRRGRLAPGEFRLRRAAACCAGRRQPTRLCRLSACCPQTTRRRPAAGRGGGVRQADARRRRKSGGAIRPRLFPASRSSCHEQHGRFVPRNGCRHEPAARGAGSARAGARTDFPAAASASATACCRAASAPQFPSAHSARRRRVLPAGDSGRRDEECKGRRRLPVRVCRASCGTCGILHWPHDRRRSL